MCFAQIAAAVGLVAAAVLFVAVLVVAVLVAYFLEIENEKFNKYK